MKRLIKKAVKLGGGKDFTLNVDDKTTSFALFAKDKFTPISVLERFDIDGTRIVEIWNTDQGLKIIEGNFHGTYTKDDFKIVDNPSSMSSGFDYIWQNYYGLYQHEKYNEYSEIFLKIKSGSLPPSSMPTNIFNMMEKMTKTILPSDNSTTVDMKI